MQTRNDYDVVWQKEDGPAGTGIFNGDVGVIQDIDSSGELIVLRFDDRTATYTADLLSQLDMAYAITVHKSQGIDYVAAHPEVRDVLLSGGDSLMVDDETLEYIIKRVRAIPHVEIVRLGSRTPREGSQA